MEFNKFFLKFIIVLDKLLIFKLLIRINIKYGCFFKLIKFIDVIVLKKK